MLLDATKDKIRINNAIDRFNNQCRSSKSRSSMNKNLGCREQLKLDFDLTNINKLEDSDRTLDR